MTVIAYFLIAYLRWRHLLRTGNWQVRTFDGDYGYSWKAMSRRCECENCRSVAWSTKGVFTNSMLWPVTWLAHVLVTWFTAAATWIDAQSPQQLKDEPIDEFLDRQGRVLSESHERGQSMYGLPSRMRPRGPAQGD